MRQFSLTQSGISLNLGTGPTGHATPFQPMRRRACVYQQTNQNIAAVIKYFQKQRTQLSFRGSQAYF